MNRIIQTFWTKPMKNMYLLLRLAYASAKSIKAQGYELVVYTDSKGAKLLEGFPYDEVIVLDELENINPKMFAAVKYLALEREPLGSIHVDFDVIIDSPCLSFEDGKDVFVQCKEAKTSYKKVFNFIKKKGCPEALKECELSNYPFNVGIVGFNNEELKNEYLAIYREAIDIYKDIEIPHDITLDLVFEQSLIATLVEQKEYVPQFIDTCDIEDCRHYQIVEKCAYYETKGYTHYHTKSKFTREVQEKVCTLLSREDMTIINYNICKKEEE